MPSQNSAGHGPEVVGVDDAADGIGYDHRRQDRDDYPEEDDAGPGNAHGVHVETVFARRWNAEGRHLRSLGFERIAITSAMAMSRR